MKNFQHIYLIKLKKTMSRRKYILFVTVFGLALAIGSLIFVINLQNNSEASSVAVSPNANFTYVFGQVMIQDSNKNLTPAQNISIFIDGVSTITDSSGYYSQINFIYGPAKFEFFDSFNKKKQYTIVDNFEQSVFLNTGNNKRDLIIQQKN